LALVDLCFGNGAHKSDVCLRSGKLLCACQNSFVWKSDMCLSSVSTLLNECLLCAKFADYLGAVQP